MESSCQRYIFFIFFKWVFRRSIIIWRPPCFMIGIKCFESYVVELLPHRLNLLSSLKTNIYNWFFDQSLWSLANFDLACLWRFVRCGFLTARLLWWSYDMRRSLIVVADNPTSGICCRNSLSIATAVFLIMLLAVLRMIFPFYELSFEIFKFL